MNILPFHLLKGIQYLTQNELEKHIKKSKVISMNGWNKEINKDVGIFIDLSQLRWVNIGALVQLTLLIERAKKDDIQTYIALPLIKAKDGEVEASKLQLQNYRLKELSLKKNLIEMTSQDNKLVNDNSKNRQATQGAINKTDNEKDDLVKAIKSTKTKIKNIKFKIENIEEGRGKIDLLSVKRKKTNNFLKVLQFPEAVKCMHIDNGIDIKLTEQYVFISDQINEDSFYNSFESKNQLNQIDSSAIKYKVLFPLKWITQTETEFNKYFSQEMRELLVDSKKGIDLIDIASLENVIFTELLKNVKEHAGKDTSHALMAVGLLPTSILSTKKINNKKEIDIVYSNDLEKEYVDWINLHGIKHYIEIYFGDSGIGIINDEIKKAYKSVLNHPEAISDYKTLKWTFGKWSTRKIDDEIRGTKGLYRIKRIVDKYKGNFLIRTGNLYGGYERGGNNNSIWREVKNPYFQYGTTIQIKLCPHTEVAKLNFQLVDNNKVKPWKLLLYRDEAESKEESLKELSRWLNKEIVSLNDENTICILDIDFDMLNKVDKKLESIFVELSKNKAKDDGLIIYLPQDRGSDTLLGIIDSIQNTIICDNAELLEQEAQEKKHEEVYDPIIVIGKGANKGWFGGDKKIINILNEISTLDKCQPLDELNSYKILDINEQGSVKMYLESTVNLISQKKDGEIVLSFSNIKDAFRTEAEKFLLSCKDSQHVITPKLEIREDWCNVQEKLKKEYIEKFSIAMYMEASEKLYMLMQEDRMKQVLSNDISLSNVRFFIDHKQQLGLAEEFAKNAKNNNSIYSVFDNIDMKLPRRVQLFKKDELVVILTTIVSSAETIRDMIKQILRDEAQPLFVVTIANYYNDTVITWDKPTPIVALSWNDGYKKPETAICASPHGKDSMKYIKVNYGGYEDLSDGDIEKEVRLDKTIREHIINTDSLHYGHIGKFNKRHFAFYLNKETLLNTKRTAVNKKYKTKEAIFEQYYNGIKIWREDKKIDKFYLYYPKLNKDPEGIFDDCIAYIKNQFQDSIESIYSWDSDNPETITHANIVYIDFGSLTGSTIDTLFSSIKNTEHIHISLLFSQISDKKRNFYSNIESINVPRSSKTLFVEDEEGIEKNLATVNINYIYRLPLEHYNVSTCPICEHRNNLDKYNIGDPYIEKYYTKRKDILEIVERRKIKGKPIDFYGKEQDASHKLSSDFIMKLYELKLLIECATKYTKCRLRFYSYICSIYDNKEEEAKNINSDMYALLYYLSYELHWVRKEPLRFKKFKKPLSEIALYIATLDPVKAKKEWKLENDFAINVLVRHKYAAISVLRASNKNEFCQNIYKIFKNSILKDKQISNSLLQNIVLHISSLHINSYNESSIYFEKIHEELEKINNNYRLLPEQKALLFNIGNRNRNKSQKLLVKKENRGDIDTVKLIKSLLEEEFGTVEDPITHPPHSVDMQELDFTDLFKPSEDDFMEKKQDSIFYEYFHRRSLNLVERWERVSVYLGKLYPTIKSLSKEVLESEILKDLNDSVIENFTEHSEQFTHMLHHVHADVFKIINYRTSYKQHYDFFYDNFLKMEQKRNILIVPKVYTIFSKIPASIEDAFNEAFSKDDFLSIEFVEVLNHKVFYSTGKLSSQIRHIRNNISTHDRLTSGKNLTDVTVSFNMKEEDNYIICTIENDCSKKDLKPNSKGGLAKMKNEFERFGGDLTYSLSNEGNFIVTLKLLKY